MVDEALAYLQEVMADDGDLGPAGAGGAAVLALHVRQARHQDITQDLLELVADVRRYQAARSTKSRKT